MYPSIHIQRYLYYIPSTYMGNFPWSPPQEDNDNPRSSGRDWELEAALLTPQSVPRVFRIAEASARSPAYASPWPPHALLRAAAPMHMPTLALVHGTRKGSLAALRALVTEGKYLLLCAQALPLAIERMQSRRGGGGGAGARSARTLQEALVDAAEENFLVFVQSTLQVSTSQVASRCQAGGVLVTLE